MLALRAVACATRLAGTILSSETWLRWWDADIRRSPAPRSRGSVYKRLRSSDSWRSRGSAMVGLVLRRVAIASGDALLAMLQPEQRRERDGLLAESTSCGGRR